MGIFLWILQNFPQELSKEQLQTIASKNTRRLTDIQSFSFFRVGMKFYILNCDWILKVNQQITIKKRLFSISLGHVQHFFYKISFLSFGLLAIATKCITIWNLLFKGPFSGLKRFLSTESPLKMMTNAFYFTLKAFFFLMFTFLSRFFGNVEERLDY